MPVYKAPIKDFQFVLREMLPLMKYKDVQGFHDATEMADPVLEAGAQLCEEVLFPLNQSGDKEGLTYANGAVTTPKGFKEAYKAYCDGGWPSFTCDQGYGGQGLPEYLNMPIMEMACSANLSFGLTPGLSHGAYNALMLHGTDALRQKYLPKLVSGDWSGVMCLTEPQAGTDLGLIRTKATPAEDGSYRIEGGKIFISSGEHDLTENILHLVLARLPGAPRGTKGISLFLVPKFLVKDNGAIGERNALRCEGIEHKMGLTASPTCVMQYNGATGWLVGEPNKGMRAMFTMMNAARLYVGVQGLGLAEVAYQNALVYAKERLQSRSPTGPKMPEKPADPLIVHPDIQRMILTMRAFTEGARALAMMTAFHIDLAHRHTDPDVKQNADDFVQLMTPIVKAYLTDMGSEVSNLAVQVYGGYGYIKDYGVEQYVRDARIAQIYEGTNGIQSLDLIGRKLSFANGRYLRAFFHPVDAFITAHKDNPAMAEFLKPLQKHIGYLQQATIYIVTAGLKNPEDAAAGATEYLRLFALVVMAWVWASQAAVALEKQASDTEFYNAKLATARFYFARILPGTVSLLQGIVAGSKSLSSAVL
jgi:alkylation response protein AidB-like acyl-CoA dehydrogenase